MTPKQKEKVVARAVKALHAAADALSDLSLMCSDHGVDDTTEQRFREEIRERAFYWDSCKWWKK